MNQDGERGNGLPPVSADGGTVLGSRTTTGGVRRLFPGMPLSNDSRSPTGTEDAQSRRSRQHRAGGGITVASSLS